MPAKTEKQREVMAIEDAAYIAGFFDGEGYATIRRRNLTKVKNPSYGAVIGFTNTDVAILQWIQVRLGGNLNPKSRKSLKHSPAFELTISNPDAVRYFITAVAPFVQIKNRQLAVLSALLSMGHMRKQMILARGKTWPLFAVIPGEVERREALKVELNGLNKRGPIAG